MRESFLNRKRFQIALTSLKDEMALVVKNATESDKKKHKTLLKKYVRAVKLATNGLNKLEKDLPPKGTLDTLYEKVIESSKVAETKPTIDNRQLYKTILADFIVGYNSASDEEKELWKEAHDETQKELARITKKLEEVLAVKDRIDNLEQTASARIFCIIKGINPDGTEWGRIDFVGNNYIMQHKDKVSKGASSNNLPLVVKYYTFEDGAYNFEGESNQLETPFDKQLMDVFQKANGISYEIHKNFNRDFEYTPKLALIEGKGPWYLNIGKPITPERIAKIIEVPDWDDYGFQDLYDEYVNECGNEKLTNENGDILKEKMMVALKKQEELIQKLNEFHITKNDGDKDTEILIKIWEERKGAFKESMNTSEIGVAIPY